MIVLGYATNFAPADGITATCATDLSAARACVEDFSPPSFSSGRTFVKPIPGTLVDAGDIPVFALPFVVLPDDATLQPRPRQPDAPRDLRFTVADAVGFVDPNRLDAVVIQITRNGQTIPIEPDSETGVIVCADATRNPSPNDPRCSALDDLQLRGLRIVASNLEIGSGPATLTITARDENGCHSTASFDFIFGMSPKPDSHRGRHRH